MGRSLAYDRKGDLELRRAAMERFTQRARRDAQIVACFYFGSTIRGDYWDNSDIDVILITTDESIGFKQYVLIEDSYWFEICLYSRRHFRELADGMTSSPGPSSMRHSGILAHCSDSSLKPYFSQDNQLGEYEKACRLFQEGSWWYFFFQKLHKYCGQGKVKRAYHILGFIVSRFATLLILEHGLIPEREELEQALELAPETFTPYADYLYDAMPDIPKILEAAEGMRGYIRARLRSIFFPLIDFLKDEGRMIPLSVIHSRFSKVLNTPNSEFTFGACELLVQDGILGKSILEIRLTKRSTQSFVEPAYRYLSE